MSYFSRSARDEIKDRTQLTLTLDELNYFFGVLRGFEWFHATFLQYLCYSMLMESDRKETEG